MKENFKKIMDEILKNEGGYINHPDDPGGATNRGITRCTLAAYRGVSCNNLPIQAVKDLTLEETLAIYRINYWDRCLADDLPNGVDYVVVDYAVNSGVARSAKLLQKIVGANVDGIIGLQTLDKVNAYQDCEKLINIACDHRLAFLQRLRIWRTFKRGWTRRVEGVREEALEMLSAHQSSATTLNIANPCGVLTDTPQERSIKEIAIALGIW